VLDEVVSTQRKEVDRRIRMLRKGEPLPALCNRVVILVDDGIATGATLMAAIKMCRNQKAAKIVVAAPVSGMQMFQELQQEVDDVVVLNPSEAFYAVSHAYFSFPQVSDEEVLALLEKWKEERSSGRKFPASPQIVDEP
jgi:putative phosphoribosyl transferase